MKLTNVLNSELRDEALRRWKIAREVAKRVNGVIYGSMAAMIVEGLPRLPKEVYIGIDGDLNKFLELFKEFSAESWYNVTLYRRLPDAEENGKPQYSLLFSERDQIFLVHILSEEIKPNKKMDNVRLRFERKEYIQQIQQTLSGTGFPSILEILDLFWFEGEKAWDFVNLLPKDIQRRILNSVNVYTELIPKENRPLVREIVERIHIL